MIKVVCYVKECSNPDDVLLHNDICVESINDDYDGIFIRPKKVMISVGKSAYIVEARDMITAIENCMNNNT